MNVYKFFLFLFLLCSFALIAQDSGNVPVRTPEQEATRQTEKLKQELNLTNEQIKQVYEINLHYAKLRQASNSRAEAMERVKRKNADLKRVLDSGQYDKLQNKHYERSTYQIPNEHQRPVKQIPESQQQNNGEQRDKSQTNAENSGNSHSPSERPDAITADRNLQNEIPSSRMTTSGSRPAREVSTQQTNTPRNRTNRTTARPSRHPVAQPNVNRQNSSPHYDQRPAVPAKRQSVNRTPDRTRQTNSPQRQSTRNRR